MNARNIRFDSLDAARKATPGFRFTPDGRMDAAENAHYERELRSIWATNLDPKNAEEKALSFIPLDTETDPLAELYEWWSFTHYGSAVLLRDYTEQIPRSNVAGEQHVGRIYGLASSFEYNWMEVRRAASSKRPIPTEKAKAARRAISTAIDETLAFGNTALNMVGFYNHPNVPLTTLPDGASGDAEWDNKTGLEIVADLNRIAAAPLRRTKEIEKPDTIVLPPAALTYINTTPMHDGSDTTVAEYFLKHNDSVRYLESWYKGNTAGAGGLPRGVCYKRSPDILRGIVPIMYEQLPPEVQSMLTVNNVHARIGGVVWMFPWAATYFDGMLTSGLISPS